MGGEEVRRERAPAGANPSDEHGDRAHAERAPEGVPHEPQREIGRVVARPPRDPPVAHPPGQDPLARARAALDRGPGLGNHPHVEAGHPDGDLVDDVVPRRRRQRTGDGEGLPVVRLECASDVMALLPVGPAGDDATDETLTAVGGGETLEVVRRRHHVGVELEHPACFGKPIEAGVGPGEEGIERPPSGQALGGRVASQDVHGEGQAVPVDTRRRPVAASVVDDHPQPDHVGPRLLRQRRGKNGEVARLVAGRRDDEPAHRAALTLSRRRRAGRITDGSRRANVTEQATSTAAARVLHHQPASMPALWAAARTDRRVRCRSAAR